MSKVAQVVRASARPSPSSLPTPEARPARKGFDFSVIQNPETRAKVVLNVKRIDQSMRRTAYEIVEIGRNLAQIRECARGSFEALCWEEFGMDVRVARRFIDTARFVDEQLLPANPNLLDHVTPTVLYRLAAGDLSLQIVEDAVREAGNEKITSKDLRAAIERAAETLEEKDKELQSAMAELASAKATLAEAAARSDQAELQASRLKEERDKLSFNLRRAQDEISSFTKEHGELQQEIRKLKEQAEKPKIKEVEVPKIPAGYSTLEQAIAGKEKQLRELENQISGAQDKLSQAERCFAAVQEQATLRQSSVQLLASFRTDIQALSAKYSEVLVAAREADPRIAAECNKVAAGLRVLADFIDAHAAVRRAAA